MSRAVETTQYELLTGKSQIWNKLTKAVQGSEKKSYVAVAYFSKIASTMLPLSKGSIIVVDAAENTVKNGLTCPAELLKLYKRGVRIYTYSGLHAKLFAFNDVLYVGSTNASYYSANYLEEAVLKCKDPTTVKQAVRYIKSLCSKELGYEALTELQKKYKAPKFSGQGTKRNKGQSDLNKEPKVYVVKLRILKRSYDVNSSAYVSGKAKAENAVKDWDRHIIEDYQYSIEGKPKIGDVVIRVTRDDGKVTVAAPATILNIQRIEKSKQSFVFVEAPDLREKSLRTVSNFLRSNELNKAGRKTSDLAARLNSLWI